MTPFRHRLAVATAVATWILLFAGAMVTSTGSGLSVPDWPMSYGQWMPPMVGGVFFEHGHRMIAGVVAMLTLVLALTLAAREPRIWIRNLGFLALALVVVQATLGGLTVLLRLPPGVSVSHAILGQTFFCLTAVIAAATSPRWETRAPGYRPGDRGLFVFALVLTVGFFIQLFLGAVTRHLHAGLAIPDFPTVYGGFLPPVWNPQIAFHFAHRMGAYTLAVLVLVFCARVVSREKTDRTRVVLAVSWVGLIAVQILLGALTIWTRRNVGIASLHLAVGALCLMVSVLLSFRIGWAALPERSSPQQPSGALEPA